MADFCSLAQVRTWLNKAVTDTADDAELTRLIGAVSADIRGATGQSLAIPAASFTETRNGRGGTLLYLHEQPVASVQSLTVNGVAIPASTAWNVNGYVVDAERLVGSAYLRLIGSVFTKGIANVGVVYTAGFAAAPADLEDLAIRTVGHRYVQKRWIGQQSRRVGDDTQSYDKAPWPAEVQPILGRYVRQITG